MRAPLCLLVASLAAAAVACGEAPPPKAPAAPVVEAPPKPAPTGAVTRLEVEDVVHAGPGYFLRTLETEPVLDHNTFRGFKLVTLPTTDRWKAIDLRNGDVVTKVNGASIAMPDDAQAVFEKLPAGKSIVVEGERAGKPFTTTIPIVD